MDDHDKAPVLISVLAAALFAAFIWIKRSHQPKPAVVAPQSVEASTPAPSDAPAETYDAPPVPVQQPGSTTVYECNADGRRMFSDYPCGQTAQARTVTPQNVVDMPKVQPIDMESYHPVRGSQTYAADDDEPARLDCKPYEVAVARWDARMRMGYTSQEGEWLRDQRREAAKVRDKCERENRGR